MNENPDRLHAAQAGDEWKIKLDIPTMEKRIVHYPEELREPVLWLSSYLVQECGRDLDVLADTARKLGIETPKDKSTWSRIIRGLWNRTADGRNAAAPLVKLSVLLRAIDALKRDAQLKEKAGRVAYIKTSRGEAMFNFVDALRAPDRVNKFGIIVGRTGTEKSATLKEYCRLNNHLACVHQEAPARPSYSQFVTDLCEKYNGTRQMSWGRMMNHIYEAVNEKRTIVVENVQRLYVERRGADQPVFNFLQKVQDETSCTIILTITPVFADTLTRKLASGYFEQFIGRAGGLGEFLRLPDYASEEDIELIAGAFGLKNLSATCQWRDGLREESRKSSALDYLARISREPGLIRVLFGALQKAKVAAEMDKERITIERVIAERGED